MGLGAAFAERLASGGIDLILVDHAADALAQHADGLRQRFPTVQVREAVADLADASEVERV
jgi:short-subunit dehydrogenase